ncbi:MAG: nucleotidyltransferase family protein [Vicinamibacterales bacterium]
MTPAAAAVAPCTKAVILARGLGKRMRASDDTAVLTPGQAGAADAGVKAMIPFGRPFLNYVLSALADAGYSDICVVVAPDHHEIRDYYTTRTRPTRFRISFAVQDKPLGTADAVLAAEAFTAGEPFIVLNSDNYYPSEVLALLRAAEGPATIGFSCECLVRDGNISRERIAAYAILEPGDDGCLLRITEKPVGTAFSAKASLTSVSMNCWLLTPEIFPALRNVQPSPRGELELPLAVQYAIDVLGMRFRVIRVNAPVLDLSSRADIPAIAERLQNLEVQL